MKIARHRKIWLIFEEKTKPTKVVELLEKMKKM
jgi:hypothetical protein